MTAPRELRLAEGDMLLVDKPEGWTSFDVVNKIRRLFGVKKIGHAGTLDPRATGLLIVCTGRKTKEIATYQGQEKEYEAWIVLGGRTESFDLETPVIDERSTAGITAEMVRAALQGFVGIQTQLPPMYSAAKVGGRRLYEYAQRGVLVERRPREVLIRAVVPRRIEVPDVECTIVCSKGTYVRTLADDLGRRLGCGAYLKRLIRTRIGPYVLSEAWTIQDLVDYRHRLSAGPA